MNKFVKSMILTIGLLVLAQNSNAQCQVRVINNTGCGTYDIDINWLGGSLSGQPINSTLNTTIPVGGCPAITDVTVNESTTASSVNILPAAATSIGTCSSGSTQIAWTVTCWTGCGGTSYVEITIY